MGKTNRNKTPERERFDTSKPQFRQQKAETSKVVLDERFSSVLTDPRFQLGVKDKYGRKTRSKSTNQATGESLIHFYTVEDGKEQDKVEKERRERNSKPEESSSSATSEDEKELQSTPASRIAYLTALSRGQLDVSSSSDEEDEDNEGGDVSSGSDDDSSVLSNQDIVAPGVLDPSSREEDISITYESSRFLAVMNLDWVHVRSVDIFALVASFVPPGAVKNVQIFPSDFGKEMMAKEVTYGPSGLWTNEGKHQESEVALDGCADRESDGEGSESEAEIATTGQQESNMESDFDPEKLRAYEASKLKYYFGIVEFASPEHADIVYKEVDGLEFEHSSAAVDLRLIAESDLLHVVKDRPVRDEARSIPSNYEAPDFIVSALQQTNVECTWESGDRDRERYLTKYASGEAWHAVAENDDLKAYLASDVSSDDEEEGSDNEKAARMRRMLGLQSDGDDATASQSSEGEAVGKTSRSVSDEENVESDVEDDQDMSKEITFIPGHSQNSLQEKIRCKLNSKGELDEPTPWQKYQEKRKQKRRERRQAARAKRKEVNIIRNSDMPGEGDDFFVDEESEKVDALDSTRKQTREELELLVAGDDDIEFDKDYDMRELRRLEKNKDKKLKGSRKRKEDERAAAVPGADFKINIKDGRFRAVLDGDDDRFGIDRTDPNFKETMGMRTLLSEQSRRRNNKKRKTSEDKVVPNVEAHSDQLSSGASALSELVKSIKSKVDQ